MLRICSVLVLLALTSPATAGINGTIRVIDGDTLDVGGVRVRLHGIDAPEIGQVCQTEKGEDWDCGTWVSRQVRSRYQGAVARCLAVDKDHFNRVVATCEVKGSDMGRDLVRDGLAVAFRKFSSTYLAEEDSAVRARIGLHSGTFQRPRAYRRGLSVASSRTTDGCLIKGNISAAGARIFHAPGQRYYEATRINPKNGERWFCSEDDARSAGWRKAKR